MKKRRIREKIILHPVMSLLLLIFLTIIISAVLSWFNISSTYSRLNGNQIEYISTTESITNLLSLRGIKYIFANTVSNFANFTVLSNLIIVLIGIGIMEYSGFLKTAIGLLTRKAKKNVITFVIVLCGVLASILGNLPFIAFIPLSALIFKHGKRNPSIGVIASFASMTCGYALSIFFTSVDSQVSGLSILASKVLDPNYSIGSFSYILIMCISIIVLSLAITYVTENYIARKVPKYEFESDDVLETKDLSKSEMRGLVLAGMGSIVYLVIIIYNVIPGLPFSGNFLNYSETLYIDKLFGDESFFANGFVFIVILLFIIWGLLYGIGAKTIKNDREFIDSLGHSLNGIGKTLVFIFASATLISIFKQSNIGNVIVGALTNLITNSNFSGLGLVILLFLCSGFATIFVPTTITKWAIMSSTVVPTFLNAGLSSEFAQLVFRLGESVSLCLTPLFAYFIVYLSFLELYNKNRTDLTLGKAIKYQIPYACITFLILLAIIIIWYIISLPLGIGGSVAL